jgi:hypothetical protein
MSIQTGQVAVVTRNKYGYGMKIEGNDDWFNSKFDPKCQKGDMVKFDDKDKGYIDGLEVTGSAAADSVGGKVGHSPANSSGGWDKRQTSIVRQNAVTNANVYLGRQPEKAFSVETLLEVARQIEVYTLGNEEKVVTDEDAEQAAALKALAEGTG